MHSVHVLRVDHRLLLKAVFSHLNFIIISIFSCRTFSLLFALYFLLYFTRKEKTESYTEVFLKAIAFALLSALEVFFKLSDISPLVS